MSRRNTNYSELLRVDDADTLRLEIHPNDSRVLMSFLRAFDLEFTASELATGETELIFRSGTKIGQAHSALDQFDELSLENREDQGPPFPPR